MHFYDVSQSTTPVQNLLVKAVLVVKEKPYSVLPFKTAKSKHAASQFRQGRAGQGVHVAQRIKRVTSLPSL